MEEEGISAVIFTVNTLTKVGKNCPVQVMAFLVQPKVYSCNSVLIQAVTAGSSGILLKMRPKRFLKIILYFPKYFLPRLLHMLDVVLTDRRDFTYYFNLTYSWLESLTTLLQVWLAPWAPSVITESSFTACSHQHRVISHVLCCSLAHLLAHSGKLHFVMVLMQSKRLSSHI